VSFTELKAKALRLRPAQRARLANELIRTLDKDEATPPTLLDLDRRAEELRSGRVQGIPANEVIASARRRLSA
jgi:hypothetical protein